MRSGAHTGIRPPLGFVLRRAQRIHTALWHDIFEGRLTGPQYSCLLAIGCWPESDQQLAGEIVGLDKATTGGIIERLVQRGLVRRGVDPDDQRRYLLFLTEEGRAAMPEFAERGMAVHRALVALLPEGAEPEFIDLLVSVAHDPGHSPHVPALANPGYPVMDLRTSVGHLLRRTHQRYQAQWSQTFGGKITIAQYAVLAAGCSMAETGQQSPDQQGVAERAGLDVSSAASVLTRMETEGWLRRETDPRDKRRRILTFSPAARLAAEWSVTGVHRVDDLVFGAIGDSRRQRLFELLSHLIQSQDADRSGHSRGPGPAGPSPPAERCPLCAIR
jgi:DNA-binding MarR family transcriptional regulator